MFILYTKEITTLVGIIPATETVYKTYTEMLEMLSYLSSIGFESFYLI